MNPPFPPHQPPNLYNLLPPQVMQQPVPHQMLAPGMAAAGAISSAAANSTYCYMTKRMLGESDSARAKRLAKNAERMRQKRAAAAGIPYQPKPQDVVPPIQQQVTPLLDQTLNTPPPPQQNQQYNSQPVPVSSAAPVATSAATPQNSTPVKMTKLQMAGETEEQRVRRLAKNAERMRQKRAAQAAAAYQQQNSNPPPTQVNPGYTMPPSVQLPANLYAVPVQLHQIVQPVPGPALPGPGQVQQPHPQLQSIQPAPQQAPAPRPSGPVLLTKCQLRLLNETPEQRATRLAKNAERMRQKRAAMTFEEYKDLLIRNAERMRQKRANKSFEEYKLQLAKNAEANRRRRQNETPEERAVRHMRNAMRQRLRRAMETPEQKAVRKARLAERMRQIRASETPDQRKVRLAKGAERARNKFLSESPEERAERNRKKAEYARIFRSPQQKQQRRSMEHQPAADGIKAELISPNSNSSQLPPGGAQHSQPTAQLATHSGSSYAINYSDFGAAFPVALFNHPQIKNGQQGGYNAAYPVQPYYPELSVPTPAPYTPKGTKSQSQQQQQQQQQQQPSTSKGKR